MGLIMVTVPLARAARDGKTLQRAIWDRAAEHIESSMLSSRAAQQIMTSYAALQASDGLANGDWSAGKDGLNFMFSDAAGLCVCESNAVWHWLQLAVLDLWSEVETLVAGAGAKLGPPCKVVGSANRTATAAALLKQALTAKQSSVLFLKGKALAYAPQADAPGSDHPIALVGKNATLGSVPAADRARVRDAIVRGTCLCEACEKLRAMNDVAASPPRTPARKLEPAPADVSPLTTAKVVHAAELKSAKKSTVVALDLGVGPFEEAPPSPAALAMLPSLPLRALSLRRTKMRVLPEEVLACSSLEVLDLEFTGRVRFPEALTGLSRLRAIWYDPSPRGTNAEDKALLCRIPSLEIIDGPTWGSGAPPALREMTRLRHLQVSPTGGKYPLIAKMRLESVITDAPCRELEDSPLRYFEGPVDALPSSLSTLEFLETEDALPAKRLRAPKLRAVSVSDAVPAWLADVPTLEFLRVWGNGEVSVIPRLTSLRCLIVNAAVLASGKLDLRPLRGLRLLGIIGSLPKSAPLPDLRPLEKLALVSYEPSGKDAVPREVLAKSLPARCRVADPKDWWHDWRSLTWFRALYTTRAAPEWWLSRFWHEDGFERVGEILS